MGRLARWEYVEDSLPYDSYVNPWNFLTIKDRAVEKRVAHVSETVVAATGAQVQRDLSLDSTS